MENEITEENMKAPFWFLITLLITSCMNVTIPDFKSDKNIENKKSGEVGNENEDNVDDADVTPRFLES